MINAGKYKHRITVYKLGTEKDADGFSVASETRVGSYRAAVNTTSGMTLIKSNTDFEKAYTRFTIRYPKAELERGMIVNFNGTRYKIEYVNNIDYKNTELELQCVAVVK